MQAVILVGGEGTRLRPLTSTLPKPIVTLVDRPFISFMLEWLREHGIDDVIMSCGFLATSMRSVLGDGSEFGVRLRFVEEPEPLGTAGALKLAEHLLDDHFLMLNGDVLTDIDITAQVAQHERTGALATLALVPVPDPSAYGLVNLHKDFSVKEFREKPTTYTADENLISAGVYVLEKQILDLVEPEQNVSIEREVWPQLVGNGLYGFPSESYWLDIGTPDRYLQGTFDIIGGKIKTAVSKRLIGGSLVIEDGREMKGKLTPPAVLEHGVRVGEGAQVGGMVVLGENVSIGANSIVERSVILSGTEVGEGCILRDCIIAADCRVGAGAQITEEAMVGEGVSVGAGSRISKRARIFPGIELPEGAVATKDYPTAV
jgi:mannose-1-phosphate guanylyltransferase